MPSPRGSVRTFFLLLALTGLVAIPTGCASRRFDHPALAPGEETAASLVVIRRSEFAYSGGALTLRLDGEKLLKLRTGSYAEFQVRPGGYRMTLDDPQYINRRDAAVLDLELEAGSQTYVLLGQADIAWSVSVSAASSGNVSLGGGATPIMGLTQIHEEPARQLMGQYELFGGTD